MKHPFKSIHKIDTRNVTCYSIYVSIYFNFIQLFILEAGREEKKLKLKGILKKYI